MPARTNKFQAFVKRIEACLNSVGGVVEESAMVRNHASNKDIEIDILITFSQGRRVLRVAIECRDSQASGRPQGPSWIRELKTKRDSCRLDKIAAVSALGFSEPALEEAKSYGVETIVPEEITEESLRKTLLPTGVTYAKIMRVMGISFRVPLSTSDVFELLMPCKTRISTNEIGKAIHDHLIKNFLINNAGSALAEAFDDTYKFPFVCPLPQGTSLMQNGDGNHKLLDLRGDASIRVISVPFNDAKAFNYGESQVTEFSGNVTGREMHLTIPGPADTFEKLHVDVKDGTLTVARDMGIPLYLELTLFLKHKQCGNINKPMMLPALINPDGSIAG